MVWVAKQQAAGLGFADVLADFEVLVRRIDEGQGSRSNNRRKPRARK